MNPDNPPHIRHSIVLTSKRVTLIPSSPDHADVFFNLIKSNKNRLLDSFPILISKTQTPAMTQGFLKSRLFEWEESSIFSFLVKLNSDHNLIGYITVKSINWKSGLAELAYFIDSNHEGKGYIKESINCIITWSFNDLNLKSLYVRIIPGNEPSKQVAIRNGFKWKTRHDFEFRTSTGELVNLDYYFPDRKDFDSSQK